MAKRYLTEKHNFKLKIKINDIVQFWGLLSFKNASLTPRILNHHKKEKLLILKEALSLFIYFSFEYHLLVIWQLLFSWLLHISMQLCFVWNQPRQVFFFLLATWGVTLGRSIYDLKGFLSLKIKKDAMLGIHFYNSFKCFLKLWLYKKLATNLNLENYPYNCFLFFRVLL